MKEKEKFYYTYETKIGSITIAGGLNVITMIKYGKHSFSYLREQSNEILDKTAKELEEYLIGNRKQFDVPFQMQGTEFQEKVWKALCTIPYGETRSYGQIAKQIGNAKASRAVGMANNKNPIMIIIPCHRVIGANGKLVGYGGGLELKKKLLEIEKVIRKAGITDGYKRF